MLLSTLMSALPLLSPALPQEPVQNNKPSCDCPHEQQAVASKAQKAQKASRVAANNGKNKKKANKGIRKNFSGARNNRPNVGQEPQSPQSAPKQNQARNIQAFAQANNSIQPQQNGVWGLADVKVRKRDRMQNVGQQSGPVIAGRSNNINKLNFVETGVENSGSRHGVWSNSVNELSKLGVGNNDVSGLSTLTPVTIVEWGGSTEVANQTSPIGGLAAISAQPSQAKKNKANANKVKKAKKNNKAQKAKKQRKNGKKQR